MEHLPGGSGDPGEVDAGGGDVDSDGHGPPEHTPGETLTATEQQGQSKVMR